MSRANYFIREKMKEIILKSIESFNKYRAPEARAKLISFAKNSFVVEFSGPFCRSCGVYDYFEDIVWFLEEENVKCKVKRIIEEKGEKIVVEFALE